MQVMKRQIRDTLSECMSQIVYIDTEKTFLYVKITEKIKTVSCTSNFSYDLIL